MTWLGSVLLPEDRPQMVTGVLRLIFGPPAPLKAVDWVLRVRDRVMTWWCIQTVMTWCCIQRVMTWCCIQRGIC
jgi:hypothetical protein